MGEIESIADVPHTDAYKQARLAVFFGTHCGRAAQRRRHRAGGAGECLA